ncbi:restriction endonuclease subunit S [Thiomonas bhubaneswarensis]|uniref:Restriction endonuclease S subunit n=1 Tax=Thiomonas bhubaneswarensis TaxID=339866 RepID=A0A0K6HSW9_9BURK|nr:restriction endonuclease subunit S [Thiomonas bhubaneswarensis]CUA93994.1 Restriction endonuclease S subunit [Thiomonas bhubaneswarensis]
MSAVIESRDIPVSWQLVPLKELGVWSGGGTPSKAKPEYWTNGSIPWVSPKDMKTERIIDSEDHITKAAVEESTAKLIPAGAVLVVTRSGILSHTLPVAISTVPVTVNQDLKAIAPKDGVLPDYLAWALRCFAREILNTCSKQGTTVASIETAALHRFEIPVAPLDQQKRIVAEIEKQFSRLYDAVANLKRVKANLKRYKAAVLKAAVEGRLVVTETELARREGRSFETGAQLLQRILETRRSQWKGKGKYKEPAAPETSDLPELPEGWVWASIDQLAAPEPNSITDGPFGSNLKTEHYQESGPRVIRLQNIKDGEFADEYAHISQMHFERLRKHEIQAGDLVIATLGDNPPRACIIPAFVGAAIVKADCIRFKPHSALTVAYLNAALNCQPTRKRVKNVLHGIGRPRLSLGEIRAIALPIPPETEQRRIVAEVGRRLSLLRDTEAQVDANLQRAERLRQSILSRAFSGGLVNDNSTNPMSTAAVSGAA